MSALSKGQFFLLAYALAKLASMCLCNVVESYNFQLHMHTSGLDLANQKDSAIVLYYAHMHLLTNSIEHATLALPFCFLIPHACRRSTRPVATTGPSVRSASSSTATSAGSLALACGISATMGARRSPLSKKNLSGGKPTAS